MTSFFDRIVRCVATVGTAVACIQLGRGVIEVILEWHQNESNSSEKE
jgi:hypothetical protein